MDLSYAKEVARACLPVGLFSQMIWSCNARSLMAFMSLRSAPDAQREIRQYSIAMGEMFKEIMPVTYDAWYYDRFLREKDMREFLRLTPHQRKKLHHDGY